MSSPERRTHGAGPASWTRYLSTARAGLVIGAMGFVLPTAVAAEGVVGRVTFVGTLGEERLPDGSAQARFRFKLSESTCSTTDGIWTNAWDGTAYTGWQPLPPAPVPLASDPAAVASGPTRIEIFAVGTDGRMYTTIWDGTRWSAWSNMGKESFSSGPAAAFEPGNNLIHLYALGQADNALWMNIKAGKWLGWSQVKPQQIGSKPAAVSWGQGRIDVFALGTNNKIVWLSTTNSGVQWTDWLWLGNEEFRSGPGVASWGPNRIDVFAHDDANLLHTNVLTGAGWSGWRSVALPPLASDPAARPLQPTNYVYARRADNQMHFAEVRRDGVVVQSWRSLGGWFAGGPAVVSAGGNQERIFALARGRADRWFLVRSGRVDGAFEHNAVNFRNAYNTVLTAFLARSVTSVQVDAPSCEESETINLPSASIGLLP